MDGTKKWRYIIHEGGMEGMADQVEMFTYVNQLGQVISIGVGKGWKVLTMAAGLHGQMESSALGK